MSVFNTRGDGGETSLVDGSRISKGSVRVDSYGTVDELNSHLGLAAHLVKVAEHGRILREVQEDLFRIAGQLAVPVGTYPRPVVAGDVGRLSAYLEEAERHVQLKGFVIPGATLPSAQLDVARTVCRRAERRVVALRAEAPETPAVLHQYLNRLADLLFTIARVEEARDGGIRYQKS